MKMILMDPEKCGGCRICEMVCAWFHNKGTINPRWGRINVIKKESEGINMPFVCLQCIEAYCMKICPVKAISMDEETGAKIVDPDLCIGCRFCVIICPFGGMSFDVDQKKVIKCDLCKDIPDSPQCVKWCPTEALRLVDLEQIGYIKKELVVTKLLNVIASLKE